MTDTTPVVTTIAAMIQSGAAGPQIVAEIVARYPNLTWRDLSEALQVATTAAERLASRRH